MHGKQKELNIFFTILIFSQSILGGNPDVISTFHSIFDSQQMRFQERSGPEINHIIPHILPPIETELIKEIDRIRRRCNQFEASI